MLKKIIIVILVGLARVVYAPPLDFSEVLSAVQRSVNPIFRRIVPFADKNNILQVGSASIMLLFYLKFSFNYKCYLSERFSNPALLATLCPACDLKIFHDLKSGNMRMFDPYFNITLACSEIDAIVSRVRGEAIVLPKIFSDYFFKSLDLLEKESREPLEFCFQERSLPIDGLFDSIHKCFDLSSSPSQPSFTFGLSLAENFFDFVIVGRADASIFANVYRGETGPVYSHNQAKFHSFIEQACALLSPSGLLFIEMMAGDFDLLKSGLDDYSSFGRVDSHFKLKDLLKFVEDSGFKFVDQHELASIFGSCDPLISYIDYPGLYFVDPDFVIKTPSFRGANGFCGRTIFQKTLHVGVLSETVGFEPFLPMQNPIVLVISKSKLLCRPKSRRESPWQRRVFQPLITGSAARLPPDPGLVANPAGESLPGQVVERPARNQSSMDDSGASLQNSQSALLPPNPEPQILDLAKRRVSRQVSIGAPSPSEAQNPLIRPVESASPLLPVEILPPAGCFQDVVSVDVHPDAGAERGNFDYNTCFGQDSSSVRTLGSDRPRDPVESQEVKKCPCCVVQ